MLAAVFAVQAIAIAAAWLLRSREQQLRRTLPYLVSVAVGVLLATALLHLLPEAVEALGNGRGVWLVTGLTLFVLFALERTFQAITAAGSLPGTAAAKQPENLSCGLSLAGVEHGPGCGHASSLRPVNLLVASSLHSFVDGTAIATAFGVSSRLGVLTAFAVALHEVPHRLGDVAVLLHLRLPASQAMRFAVAVGLPAIFGAILVLFVGEGGANALRWLLPVSAGSREPAVLDQRLRSWPVLAPALAS